MIFQDSRDGQNSKPKTEIPKQVRDDNKTRTKPSCHAELVSASGLLILPSPEASFIPVHRTGFSDMLLTKLVKDHALKNKKGGQWSRLLTINRSCIREGSFQSTLNCLPLDILEEGCNVICPLQAVIDHESVLEDIKNQ